MVVTHLVNIPPQTYGGQIETNLNLESRTLKHAESRGLVKISVGWSMEI